ncbi:carbohydrate ABC transporter substrate-binding protein, CUT1 family [Quadrisphaera granulorum]|uniref:Carbohydrate ABC transporter substrate-binding protein (CUT1 family) n=1 Tax=Quadrisphaera granulorum TaxID=317664 RepID=A0A316AC21_9ACTN|nr:extracellular solute-binding protein [Quadrisphaera granulorum]PWJ54424.1 carbohydrate ABC transporter substrate-binding protein (CUT1 family) [Quadrisphaera granulorum]SZE96196.1 carbohydrate ABC transporter substrate-binding protein, CUT1 family [Quadrisphaera granulorum]
MQLSRRSVLFAAFAASSTAALAACGSSDSSSSTGTGAAGAVDGKGKTLTVLVAAQPNYPTQFAAWSKQVTDAFTAATGATLAIETFSNSAEETTKIQASIVAGTGPDVYQLGTTFTPVAYGTGGFLELSADDWKAIGGREKFSPETFGMSGPSEDKQIGIPSATRPFVYAYNTEMFTAAGIASPPTTWNDLIAAATKLTSDGTYGMAVAYADGYDPWKYIWAFTEQTGGSYVSEDLTKAQLDSEQVKNAVAQYFGLLTQHKVVDPAAVGWKSGDALAAFSGGKAAILPMTSAAAVPALDQGAVKGKYAFAPLPDVAPGQTSRPAGAPPAQSIVSGDNLAIASYTPNKDLALAYVKLVTDAEIQQAQFTYFGNLPTNKEALAAVTSANPVLAPMAAAEKGSTPTAFTGAWADVQNGVQNVVVQSLPELAKGSVDPASTASLLEAANAKAQASLDRAAR